MFERFRGRLTYANVMSTLAVFLVLGGGAYAAVKIKKDSVKSKQIKAGAVKSAELAGDAVTSPKVMNGSLLGEDFAAGQLPQGPPGPRGEQGLQGLQGAEGSALGYADIQADGTFDAASSENLIASELTSGNIYCLQFATAPKNVVVTVNTAAAGFATARVDPQPIEVNCGVALPGANAMVLTIGASPVSGAPRRFFVAVN